MTSWGLLTSTWSWDPVPIAACALLAGWYIRTVGGRVGREAIWFGAALLLVLAALVSPIATLAESYLMSAHMLQHFLLVMIAPPLLLAAIPEGVAVPGALERVSAAACWLAGIGTMILWHVPDVYIAALHHHWLHLIEQGSSVLTGIVFWWPVFGRPRERRLHPVSSVVYLATACLCCTVLGVALTFARTEVYPIYLNPSDGLSLLSLIRNEWGISPHVDQQLGGLLMWVPGCLVYLSAMLIRLSGWYAERDSEPLSAAVEPVH